MESMRTALASSGGILPPNSFQSDFRLSLDDLDLPIASPYMEFAVD